MFLPNSAANLRWTRRPLVPFNIMALGIGMVRSLHVRDPAGWSNGRASQREEVKIHLCGGAAHKILAEIRANRNSANDTAFALVCVMPYRRDMY